MISVSGTHVVSVTAPPIPDVLADLRTVERKISHIYGNGRESHEMTETQELTNQLHQLAETMLLDFLRKMRASRRKGNVRKNIEDKIDVVSLDDWASLLTAGKLY